ncbi:hypothetical protein [Microbulbifer epialgicus]|uniref:Uncharacterized protein n=1 Tax=Microbulbifer epialgicus TaxID=393907 RepID=A0ABV4NX42_9GAMM
MPIKNEEFAKKVVVVKSAINQFAQKALYRPYPGGAFVVQNDYRVRLTADGGYIRIEQITATALYFQVKVNHLYGCIHYTKPEEWYYVVKGSHARAEFNSYKVHAIEARI